MIGLQAIGWHSMNMSDKHELGTWGYGEDEIKACDDINLKVNLKANYSDMDTCMTNYFQSHMHSVPYKGALFLCL